jgi:hypothetical protein
VDAGAHHGAVKIVRAIHTLVERYGEFDLPVHGPAPEPPEVGARDTDSHIAACRPVERGAKPVR